jgi:hypothetical protein
MAPPTDAAASTRRDGLELFITVLLVVAAVATSWSGYQAARWHGEQARATSQTNAIRIDAARAAEFANAETQVDVATFIAWSEADVQGDEKLADFYRDRFRPEFVPAFDAWIATDPQNDAGAPRTPFAMDEYEVEAKEQAAELDQRAAESADRVGEYIQRADNYVLSVVLYAVVLFFAGMATRLSNRRLRIVLVTVGYVVLISTVAWVATFPVSLAV